MILNWIIESLNWIIESVIVAVPQYDKHEEEKKRKNSFILVVDSGRGDYDEANTLFSSLVLIFCYYYCCFLVPAILFYILCVTPKIKDLE